MIETFCTCPSCRTLLKAPFVPPCPNCGFDIGHLTGQMLSDHQREKWNKHREGLAGLTVTLQGGEFNATFNPAGDAKIDSLVRFAISYGHESTLASPHGGYHNPVRIAYVPEIIGSGTSIGMVGSVPVSGFCLISAHSVQYGHSFPAITDWVNMAFAVVPGQCRFCGQSTQFGLVVCETCYTDNDINDWTKLV